MSDRTLCPHPEKVTYASKAAAKLALRRSSLHGRDSIHPYRCTCGSYHLGHKIGYRGGVNARPRLAA